MLVEDSPTQAVEIRMLLEEGAHQVMHVANGRLALDVLEREPIELVVTDLEMPAPGATPRAREPVCCWRKSSDFWMAAWAGGLFSARGPVVRLSACCAVSATGVRPLAGAKLEADSKPEVGRAAWPFDEPTRSSRDVADGVATDGFWERLEICMVGALWIQVGSVGPCMGIVRREEQVVCHALRHGLRARNP